MSTLSLVSSLRSPEKDLIHGYFRIHFSDNAPSDIIHLCLLYCFILDEFDTEYSMKATIQGFNHCTAFIPASVSSEAYDETFIACHNLIQPTGKYHWAFTVTPNANDKTATQTDASISIGLLQNHSFRQIYHTITAKVDIYIDVEEQTMTAVNSTLIHTPYTTPLRYQSDEDTRLMLSIGCKPSTSYTVEMVEYHHSIHFLHHLQINPSDAVSNVGYAQCVHDPAQRMKYYATALRMYPFVEDWNNEYLSCLIHIGQHNKAYDHAIQYKKGATSIAKLIEYFCNESQDELSYNLCQLLSDEQLQAHELVFQSAYCCSLVGSKEDAIKYYQMYHDLHCDDEEMKANTSICIGNMAQIYYFDFDDDARALELYLQLDEEEIKRRRFNAKIGSCYYKFKQYKLALQYLELHLADNADDIWAMNQISCVYDDMNDYENGKKYLRNALEAAHDDEDKAKIYTNFGVNAYFQGNLDDAIQFTKDALSLDVPLKTTAIRRNNMGKYYYKMGEYDKSLVYLKEAIEISPNFPDINGNYGIILYYTRDCNGAIGYLDRCLAKKDRVDDRELIVDCLFVYAQILFERKQFEATVKKCEDIISSDDFGKYKSKDNVYYLVTKAYRHLHQYHEALRYLELIEMKDDDKATEYKQAIEEIKAKLDQ
eukprot:161755_1